MTVENTQENRHQTSIRSTIFAIKKSQSAMEYLMTYGWAILIIAVVLVALFQLGVFNGSNFAPKAQPGSCQVFKTSVAISLEGMCNNELPQYVAQFNAPSYISISSGPTLTYNPVTLAAWYYPTNALCSSMCTFLIGKSTYGGFLRFENNVFQVDIQGGGNAYNINSANEILYQWYYVVETYNGIMQNLYVNGQLIASNTFSVTPTQTTDLGIGACIFCGPGQYTYGLVSNVQIYNTSLSANDISALYQEGIGGHPLSVQNLVGWWPLNGNANDYSGNNNNGAATNVIYSGSWASGYSAP